MVFGIINALSVIMEHYEALGCATSVQVIVLNLAPERLVCPIGTSWHICNEDGASLQTWPSRKNEFSESPRPGRQAARPAGRWGEMVGV